MLRFSSFIHNPKDHKSSRYKAMQPSNFHVDVTAVGEKQFRHIMELFFEGPSSPEDLQDDFKYWSATPQTGLALYQSEYQTNNMYVWNERLKKSDTIFLGEKIKFDHSMSKSELIAFVWKWFQKAGPEYYGEPDDIDGSQYREAYRIKTSYGYSDPTVIIKPTWAEYHK